MQERSRIDLAKRQWSRYLPMSRNLPRPCSGASISLPSCGRNGFGMDANYFSAQSMLPS